MTYNPWPIGSLPEEFRRPELALVRSAGYEFEDAREVVTLFEEKLAQYSGSKYAVVLDCASNGIFLSLKYINSPQRLSIPARTYASVPMQLLHAGYQIKFEDYWWTGLYQIGNTPIYDCSARFTPGMFIGGSDTLQVLSFQIKKRLPIGRGGAVLTNSYEAYEWIKYASYDGRNLLTPYDSMEHIEMLGWHFYMTPEDAARGLLLMDKLGTQSWEDIANSNSYPDLRLWFQRLKLDGVEL